MEQLAEYKALLNKLSANHVHDPVYFKLYPVQSGPPKLLTEYNPSHPIPPIYYEPGVSVTEMAVKPIIPKSQSTGLLHNQTIDKLFTVKHVPPEKLIGIEIEVEGYNLFKHPTKWWGVHKEDSLRQYKGHLPLEYALTQPVTIEESEAALEYLLSRLLREKTELNLSERTSTHVHLNVQSWTVKQVFTLVCLYLLFEDILVEWCGAHRVGNMFCLRARDAQQFIRQLREIVQQQNYTWLKSKHSDNIRYVSCNLASLAKFGSLEWRALRGTSDKDVIMEWIKTLCCLHFQAGSFKNPIELIRVFESTGPVEFTNLIFGDDSAWLNAPNLHDRMWDACRNIRELAFASKWEDDPPKERKKRVKK